RLRFYRIHSLPGPICIQCTLLSNTRHILPNRPSDFFTASYTWNVRTCVGSARAYDGGAPFLLHPTGPARWLPAAMLFIDFMREDACRRPRGDGQRRLGGQLVARAQLALVLAHGVQCIARDGPNRVPHAGRVVDGCEFGRGWQLWWWVEAVVQEAVRVALRFFCGVALCTSFADLRNLRRVVNQSRLARKQHPLVLGRVDLQLLRRHRDECRRPEDQPRGIGQRVVSVVLVRHGGQRQMHGRDLLHATEGAHYLLEHELARPEVDTELDVDHALEEVLELSCAGGLVVPNAVHGDMRNGVRIGALLVHTVDDAVPVVALSPHHIRQAHARERCRGNVCVQMRGAGGEDCRLAVREEDLVVDELESSPDTQHTPDLVQHELPSLVRNAQRQISHPDELERAVGEGEGLFNTVERSRPCLCARGHNALVVSAMSKPTICVPADRQAAAAWSIQCPAPHPRSST
ncbi:unnamed protein product, partial [Mycena citricolor]